MAEDIVWPYVAHPEDNRSEEYEWNTSVLTGPRFEQRISLRDLPIFTASNSYELTTTQLGQARLLMEASLRANNRLLLPLWSERVFLQTTLNGTVGQIYGDFRFTRFDPGGLAIAWLSIDEYYVLDVTAVAPDRIFIEDFTFPDLTGRKVILMPLLQGRVDGDFKTEMSFLPNKHKVSFEFRASVERNYRYKLNLCLCLDGSGSMAGSRWNNLRESLHTLLDYLASVVESGLMDLSMKIVFVTSTFPSPQRREWHNLRDAQALLDAKTWITNINANAGVFSFPNASTEVANWFTPGEQSTNIAMIMTDAEDATDELMTTCEATLADVLDVNNTPFAIGEGTAINLYAVGIDSSPADIVLISRLSNVGPAIRLAGTSLAQFNQVLQGIVFGEDTPLAGYTKLFNTYDGKAVLSRKYIDEQGVEEVITRARNVFVTPSGIDWYTNQRESNDMTSILNFEFMSDEERQAALFLLHSLRGQKKDFWLPAQNRDVVMTVTMPDLTHMHIRRNGLDNPYRLLEEFMQIETTKGELFYRRFSNAALVPSDPKIFRMTLDAAMPRLLKPTEIYGIHFMRKMRFSTDVALFSHEDLIKTRVSMATARVLERFIAPVIPAPEPVWP